MMFALPQLPAAAHSSEVNMHYEAHTLYVLLGAVVRESYSVYACQA
mgnify:CR=1 FL=1